MSIPLLPVRYLTTLQTIAGDKTNTIVFPLPPEFMSDFGSEKQ
jgi:hypothetical protein